MYLKHFRLRHSVGGRLKQKPQVTIRLFETINDGNNTERMESVSGDILSNINEKESNLFVAYMENYKCFLLF